MNELYSYQVEHAQLAIAIGYFSTVMSDLEVLRFLLIIKATEISTKGHGLRSLLNCEMVEKL